MTVESNRAQTGQNIAQADDGSTRSQSLYRKWRSQTFSELVGQDAITRTLQNAIVSGRVGHAYLFCGPRGTGKTSSARLLAKALNCTFEDVKRRPCNQCESCRAIAEGRAMDLIEIDAASNRGIDEIRSLRDTIGYQPSQLRYKFYIIDEVHMLTEPAFNALLKTLEEPPPHAVFVLATTDPQDIPATVVSRCQRFDFQRISLEQIAARLTYICGEEGIEAETSALELVARQATGSLRDALSLLDQLIVFSGGLITVDAVRSMLGVMNSEAVAEFVDSLIDQSMADGLELINQLVQSGTDLKRFNREVVEHLRTLMLVKANPGTSELLDMTHEAIEGLREQAARLDLGEVIGFLKIFSGIDYNLKVSPYGQLPLEIALMEAVLNRPASVNVPAPQPRPAATTRPVEPTAPRVNNVTTRPVSVVAAPKPAEPEPEPIVAAPEVPAPAKIVATTRPVAVPPAPPEVPPTLVNEPGPAPLPNAARLPRSGFVVGSADKAKGPERVVAESGSVVGLELSQVQAAWNKVLQEVGSQSKMTQALLVEARPVAVDGLFVVLAFRFEFHHKRVSQDGNHRNMVEDYYSKVVGQKVQVRCIMDKPDNDGGSSTAPGGNDGPDKSPGRSVSEEQRRKAAQMFNARILE